MRKNSGFGVFFFIFLSLPMVLLNHRIHISLDDDMRCTDDKPFSCWVNWHPSCSTSHRTTPIHTHTHPKQTHTKVTAISQLNNKTQRTHISITCYTILCWIHVLYFHKSSDENRIACILIQYAHIHTPLLHVNVYANNFKSKQWRLPVRAAVKILL